MDISACGITKYTAVSLRALLKWASHLQYHHGHQVDSSYEIIPALQLGVTTCLCSAVLTALILNSGIRLLYTNYQIQNPSPRSSLTFRTMELSTGQKPAVPSGCVVALDPSLPIFWTFSLIRSWVSNQPHLWLASSYLSFPSNLVMWFSLTLHPKLLIT